MLKTRKYKKKGHKKQTAKHNKKYNKRKINYIRNSYSPSVNRIIFSKNKKKLNSVNLRTLKKSLTNVYNKKCLNEESVMTSDNNCVHFKTEEGQKTLLKNLERSMIVKNPKKIIAPKQYQSNCWFNTMFMVLFISDKGRKFFKYFRHLMITGQKIKSKTHSINIPSNLHKTLFLLNRMIHNALNGTLGNTDTNVIIRGIFNNIPASKHQLLVKTGEASNPIDFYFSLMNYLDDSKISINVLTLDNSVLRSMNLPTSTLIQKNFENKFANQQYYRVPHIIILEYYDESSRGKKDTPTYFSLQHRGKKINYKLDSCIIRNTKRHHFCSTVTINNKEYGFDGMSFHRLNSFRWKRIINKDQNWTFKGSTNDGKDSILWNFKNGYQLLFYYRI